MPGYWRTSLQCPWLTFRWELGIDNGSLRAIGCAVGAAEPVRISLIWALFTISLAVLAGGYKLNILALNWPKYWKRRSKQGYSDLHECQKAYPYIRANYCRKTTNRFIRGKNLWLYLDETITVCLTSMIIKKIRWYYRADLFRGYKITRKILSKT